MLVRRFSGDRRGTSAVEFAIVGPLIFVLIFWFFDVAFSLYVRNSFTEAVNDAAREVYLDPDRTDAQLETSLAAKLGRFGDSFIVKSTREASGVIDYHVITAQMTYHFKSPPLSSRDVVLKAESRAPIITYKVEENVEG